MGGRRRMRLVDSFGRRAHRRIVLDPDAGMGAAGGGGGGAILDGATAAPDLAVGAPAAEAGFQPREEDGGPAGGAGAVEPTLGPGAGSGAGSAAAPAPAAPRWQSIREAARSYGLDLSSYPDDAAALAALVRQAQRAEEADYYAQLGRAIAPHYQGVQQYLQQHAPQGGRGGAAGPPERNEWEPPEFDERWLALVQRDEATGVFVAKPGVDPQVASKVNAYQDWLGRFQRNPTQVFQQYAQAQIPKLVQEQVREALGQYQRQQAVDGILGANASWLYQRDAAGAAVRGPDGRPLLSPQGVRYSQHVQSLARQGIADPVAQDALARQLLAGELAMAQVQGGAGAAAAGAAQRQQAAGHPNVNGLGARPAVERAATPGAGEGGGDEGLSLAEMMRRDLAQAGVGEADFRIGD